MKADTDGQIKFQIPSFIPAEKIAAPAGTVSVECRIAAAGCLLQTGQEAGQFSASYEFLFNGVEQQEKMIPLGFTTSPGTLAICGIILLYRVQGKTGIDLTKHSKFIPA